LDKAPQIPQDYANHIIYAQLLFILSLTITSKNVALLVVAAFSVGKKVVDYYKETEALQMCVSKAVVTFLSGLFLWLLLSYPAWFLGIKILQGR
jgi:RsiW-degrading membrane proteinase PrsW (M82 family)